MENENPSNNELRNDDDFSQMDSQDLLNIEERITSQNIDKKTDSGSKEPALDSQSIDDNLVQNDNYNSDSSPSENTATSNSSDSNEDKTKNSDPTLDPKTSVVDPINEAEPLVDGEDLTTVNESTPQKTDAHEDDSERIVSNQGVTDLKQSDDAVQANLDDGFDDEPLIVAPSRSGPDFDNKKQRERFDREFFPVSTGIKTHIQKSFIETADFADFLENSIKDTDNRIYCIIGKPNSGRYAASVRLAQELRIRKFPSLKTFDFLRDSTPLKLNEIVKSAIDDEVINDSDGATNRKNADSVIIIRDIFSEIYQKNELSSANIERLQRALAENNLRLILTTKTLPEQEVALRQFLYTETTDAQNNVKVIEQNFSSIFDRYTNLSFPGNITQEDEARKLLTSIQADLQTIFKTPADVDIYFREFKIQEPADVEKAVELANDIMGGRNQRLNIHDWFAALALDEKLYVMIAVLLQGFTLHDLNDIYDKAIRQLRGQEVTGFRDPRQQNIEELLLRVQLRKQNNILNFIYRRTEFRNEVQKQIEHHYHLLWSIHEIFIEELVGADDENLSRRSSNRRRRRIIASAIGQIGQHRTEHLKDVLYLIANSDKPEIMASSADILKHIAFDVSYHAFIIQLLEEWINTQEFHLKWVSTIVISELYETIADLHTLNDDVSDNRAKQTLERLTQLYTKLANTVTQFNIFFIETEVESLYRESFEGLKPNQKDYAIQKKKLQTQQDELIYSSKLQLRGDLLVAVITGIETIARSNLDDAISIINEWLSQSPKSPRWQVGRLAANRLFNSANINLGTTIDSEQIELLALLPNMLRASTNIIGDVTEWLLTYVIEDDYMRRVIELSSSRQQIIQLSIPPIDTALQTLEKWYVNLCKRNTEGNDQFWDSEIFPSIFSTINLATYTTQRPLMNALLNYWMKSNYPQIRQQGAMLMRRLQMMGGRIVNLSNTDAGVVVLDASEPHFSEYEEFVFELLQRLSAITQIQVYHLGLVEAHPLILGGEISDILSTVEDAGIELSMQQMQGHSRSRLLMPIIESMGFADPNTTPFVLVLNTGTVLDIDDFVFAYTGEPNTSNSNGSNTNSHPEQNVNPFERFLSPSSSKEELRERPTSKWQWNNKYIFLDIGLRQLTQNRQPETIEFISINSDLPIAERRTQIENSVDKKLINHVNNSSYEDQVQLLNNYLKQQEISFTDANTFFGHSSLIDDRKSIDLQYDLVGAIVYAVIISTRVVDQGFQNTLNHVIAWLRSEEWIENNLGTACAKALFRFERNITSLDSIDTKVLFPYTILSLLPPLFKVSDSYDNLRELVSTIFEWAGNSRVSQRLIAHPDGQKSEVVKAIENLELTTLRDLNEHIERMGALIEFQTQFLLFDFSLREFIGRCNASNRYVDFLESQSHNAKVPFGLTHESAIALSRLCFYSQSTLDWVVAQLKIQEAQLLQKENAHLYQSQAVNRKKFLDVVRLQIHSRVGGAFPDLPENQQYALILIDGSTLGIREEILSTLRTILMGLKNSQYRELLIPIVHRLGSDVIIFSRRGDNWRQEIKFNEAEVWPSQLQTYTPTIYPILSKYPSVEQIAITIIISASRPIDFEDLQADSNWPKWRNRLIGYPLTNIAFPEEINQVVEPKEREGEELSNKFSVIINRNLRKEN